MKNRLAVFLSFFMFLLSMLVRAEAFRLVEDFDKRVVGSDSSSYFGEAHKSVMAAEKIYFEAVTGDGGKQLWVTDGKSGGTFPIQSIPTNSIIDFTTDGENVALLLRSEVSSIVHVWLIDAESDEATYVADIDRTALSSEARITISPDIETIAIQFDRAVFSVDPATKTIKKFPLDGFRALPGNFMFSGDFFYVESTDAGLSLKRMDLSDGNVSLVTDELSGYISHIERLDGRVYFTTYGGGFGGAETVSELWESDGTVANTKKIHVEQPSSIKIAIFSDSIVAVSGDEVLAVDPGAGEVHKVGLPAGVHALAVEGVAIHFADGAGYFYCDAIQDHLSNKGVCRTDFRSSVKVVNESINGELLAQDDRLFLLVEEQTLHSVHPYTAVKMLNTDTEAFETVFEGNKYNYLFAKSRLHPLSSKLFNAYTPNIGFEPWFLSFASKEFSLLKDINLDSRTADAKLTKRLARNNRIYLSTCCVPGPGGELTAKHVPLVLTPDSINPYNPAIDFFSSQSYLVGGDDVFDYHSAPNYGYYASSGMYGESLVSGLVHNTMNGEVYNLGSLGYPTPWTLVVAQLAMVSGDFVYILDLNGTIPNAEPDPMLLFRSVDGDLLVESPVYTVWPMAYDGGFVLFRPNSDGTSTGFFYKDRKLVDEFPLCISEVCDDVPIWHHAGRHGVFIGGAGGDQAASILAMDKIYYLDKRYSQIPRKVNFSRDNIEEVKFLVSSDTHSLVEIYIPEEFRTEIVRINHETLEVETMFSTPAVDKAYRQGNFYLLRTVRTDKINILDTELKLVGSIDLEEYFDSTNPQSSWGCHLGYCYVGGVDGLGVSTKYSMLKILVGDFVAVEKIALQSALVEFLGGMGRNLFVRIDSPQYGEEVFVAEITMPDTDEDGIPDSVESIYGLQSAVSSDALEDLDGDGVSNLDEFRIGTDMTMADTDGDGLEDGLEVQMGFEPRAYDLHLQDGDGDGLSYRQEVALGTNYTLFDTDSDGVSDKEDAFPLNANEWIDSDGDGIGDNQEAEEQNADPLPETPKNSKGSGGSISYWFFILFLSGLMRHSEMASRYLRYKQKRK